MEKHYLPFVGGSQHKGPHDDVIKWKYFPRYWPFVRGIHRSPVNSPHKGQWRGAFMFPLVCAWINRSVNNREAVDLRRYRAHYDVIIMCNAVFSVFILASASCCGLFGLHGPRWPLSKKSPLNLITHSPSELLNKQLSCRWFETPWCSCDVIVFQGSTW